LGWSRVSPRRLFAEGESVPQRPHHILSLIAVALVAAAAGGWAAVVIVDGRVQLLAADMAVTVSRDLAPPGKRSAPSRPRDPDRQFRVERSRNRAAG